MITTILLYVISFILGTIGSTIVYISHGWSVWPASVLDGLTYFFTQLMNFNIFFPVDTLLTVILFFINFEVIYISVRLLLKLFNYIRGSGGVDI